MGKKGGQGPRAFAPRWVVTQPPCSPPLGPLAPGRPAQSLLHRCLTDRDPGAGSPRPPAGLTAPQRADSPRLLLPLFPSTGPSRNPGFPGPVTAERPWERPGGEAEQLAQRLLFQETESSRVSSPRTLFPEGCIRLWEKAGGTPEPFPLESVIDSPPSSASSRPGPQVWWTLTLQGVFALMNAWLPESWVSCGAGGGCC